MREVVPFRSQWFAVLFPIMKGLPAETDFVVIGAGVAGLRAAIELAAAGRVLVLAKTGNSSCTHRPRRSRL